MRALHGREALQSAILFEAFASQLLCEPSERSVREARLLIEQCGLDERLSDLSSAWDMTELQERFGDRFFVASSSIYVPLRESVLRVAQLVDGAWTYGAASGRAAIHVAHCYEAAGFSPRSAVGYTPFAERLSPDHVAIELLFLAYLNRGIAEAYDNASREDYLACAVAFVSDHAAKAVSTAAAMATEKMRDEYATLLGACSVWLRAWIAVATCVEDEI